MMDRRTWLVSTAAAATSYAANSAVTVGVLGTGNRGTFVAAAMAKNTPARIVALCDLKEERMAAASKTIGVERPRLYQDFQKMLASDIDAIIIATPVFLHAEHFEAAVKSGKHIYIEKPASADVEGCKRIMRAADAADRKVNITFGFQRRYGQLYLKAKQMADSGAVGRIRMGSARFIKHSAAPPAAGGGRPGSMPEKVASWYKWRELSGDLIVENNVHSVDVLNWFLGGRPVSAIGAGGTTVAREGDVRDHNFVAFEYAGGVQGQLSGTTLAPAGYRDVVEQFFGEKGFIETSENHWRHMVGSAAAVMEKSPRSNAVDSVAAFVQRIQEGKPENTGVRGAESTLTAILGRMAMDRRREVTWEEMMRG
ncbi:MAG: Gfo/Idh/MocA family oxidoreductase [Bryobacterales bacterium]|nr:Gfo/Idh/MocA family oxidoreductase [Bryobacterales bacterium]